MENKQIIIDGVDVSGCKYCLKMTKYRCTIQRDVYKCLCEENPNCYYKQFKRKEHECEELRKEKAEIKKYLGISDKTIIQRLEELQEFKDKLKISEYKYKQALDEIEKYLDAQQKYFDGEDYHNLLDIINEVKEQ